MKFVALDLAAERFAGSQNVLLTRVVLQALRARTFGERTLLVYGRLGWRSAGEEVQGMAPSLGKGVW